MATVYSCLQGPKIEGGRASARSLSFDGQSAAAAAKSGVPIDLMTVAARVDAGRRQLVLGQLPSSDMSEAHEQRHDEKREREKGAACSRPLAEQ